MAPSVEKTSKPGRSEEAVEAEEQARRAEQVRRMLADAAPKRPLKPSRSDDVDVDFPPAATHHPPPPPPPQEEQPIPEFLKLQSLVQSPTPILVEEYPGGVSEDYVETDYYKDLNDVDKTLHHTTGTGFIQVESHGVLSLSSQVGLNSVNKDTRTDSEYPAVAMEEFVETDYYKGLNAADKSMHHTTGTGFIQVESKGEGGAKFDCISSGLARTSSICNPATNDWVPAEPLQGDVVASDKPPRSEA